MQGNLPKLLIPKIGGGTAAALAASAYTVPDEETFVLRATAGLYPGEFVKVFEDKDLSTNPIGAALPVHNCLLGPVGISVLWLA